MVAREVKMKMYAVILAVLMFPVSAIASGSAIEALQSVSADAQRITDAGEPSRAETGPYLADNSSDLILVWLNGDPHKNFPLMAAWIRAKGLECGIVDFLYHGKYAAERAAFLADIKAGVIRAPFPSQTGPYAADNASEHILVWINSDPQRNFAVLQEWLTSNGMNCGLVEFLYHERYSSERVAFLKWLAVPAK